MLVQLFSLFVAYILNIFLQKLQKDTELQQLRQQVEMINHMENTLQSLPKCVQSLLQAILHWLNRTFGAEYENNFGKRASKKHDRKTNNCQITGATSDAGSGLLQDKDFGESESDAYSHVRLPDGLIRLISDRYRDLE